MKLNANCLRDILIAVEEKEYDTVYTISQLSEILTNYSEEELNYHCLQLIDAGFLNASTIPVMKSYIPHIARITDLTYSGHQFLADVRSDSTWEKTKSIARDIGSDSLHALQSIAVGIITSAINTKLGLH